MTTAGDVITKKAYISSRMEILRQLAILCDIVDGLDAYINDKAKRSIEFTMQTFQHSAASDSCHATACGERHHPKALRHLFVHKYRKTEIKRKGFKWFLSMNDLLDFNWQVLWAMCPVTRRFDRLLGRAVDCSGSRNNTSILMRRIVETAESAECPTKDKRANCCKRLFVVNTREHL
jgi:hypothetical protein